MKFPTEYCVRTEHLTFDSYCLLITKLVTERYKLGYQSDRSRMFDLWVFAGVNSYGDIMLYTENKDYIAVDNPTQIEQNILSGEWLNNYLGETL